jgi:nucleotide-binding universal stress UspA family protein
VSTIVAALDASAAARPVLETALRLGQLTAADVEAVHVHDGGAETPAALAERAGVRLRMPPGPVAAAVLAALDHPAALMAVLGARATPGGPRPVGGTARQILHRATKPVVVVPPDAAGQPSRPLRRLLVPLEGDGASSEPVAEVLRPILPPEVELIAVHVFTPDTVPRVLDHPARDLLLLGDEFLARHLPGASDVAFRSGPAGARIVDLCAEEQADLVVLSWSQDSSAGRAQVVREVLARATVPVLLLPVVSPAGVDGQADPAPREISPR